MGKGIFEVSYDLLKELLQLPPDTDVLLVRMGKGLPGNFEVTVEHPDLPEGRTDCDPVWRVAQPGKLISWGYKGEEIDTLQRIELLEYTVAELRKRSDGQIKAIEREVERVRMETERGD